MMPLRLVVVERKRLHKHQHIDNRIATQFNTKAEHSGLWINSHLVNYPDLKEAVAQRIMRQPEWAARMPGEKSSA